MVPPIPEAQGIADGHVSGAVGCPTGLAFAASKQVIAVFKNLAMGILKRRSNVILVLHRFNMFCLSVFCAFHPGTDLRLEETFV